MTLPINSRSTVRVPEWDGIRGMAILLVVFYHYIFGGLPVGAGGVAGVIRTVFPLSWTGVDLFFVLSGFLIGGILMDKRQSGNYFKTFYVRRACRIVPPYFVWLGLFFVLLWLCSPRSSSEWYSVVFRQEIPHFPKWGYLLFLQNLFIAKTRLFGSPWLAPTWSLAVEEQFYLFLPLVLWFLPSRRRFPVLISLIALVPALRLFLFLFHSSIFTYVLLPCRADALLLGVLCAYFVRDESWRSRLERNQRWLRLVFVVLFLGVIGLTVFAAGRDSVFDSIEMASFGFTWVALFYACLLLLVTISAEGVMARLMRNRLLRHFGLVAYGMFLIHMAVNSLAQGLILGKASADIRNLSDIAVTLLAFLITWLLAVLSWNFFEKPIIRWGHGFSYARSEDPVVLDVSTAAPGHSPSIGG